MVGGRWSRGAVGHARIERAMSIFMSSIGSDGSFNFTCNSLAVEGSMHSPVRRALCVDEDGDEGDEGDAR